MKKVIFIAALFAAMAVTPLFAQEEEEQQAVGERAPVTYVVNISVERIFPTRYGFLVQHRTRDLGMATVAIPSEWFSFAGARAERIPLRRGTVWPSMSVFFREGEFSHVRLYVHPSLSHFTWGAVMPSPEITEMFQGVETIHLQF
ncbi:MAG: hypothetical protein FWG66_03200 [Spirochaetes bacterium]|nr:hypothetical protein [Spirochaetota bacterium]